MALVFSIIYNNLENTFDSISVIDRPKVKGIF